MLEQQNFHFSHYYPFPPFLFVCLSLLTVLFLSMGTSILCVNNLKRAADLVLWFPDKTSLYTPLAPKWPLSVHSAIKAFSKLNLPILSPRFIPFSANQTLWAPFWHSCFYLIRQLDSTHMICSGLLAPTVFVTSRVTLVCSYTQ